MAECVGGVAVASPGPGRSGIEVEESDPRNGLMSHGAAAGHGCPGTSPPKAPAWGRVRKSRGVVKR